MQGNLKDVTQSPRHPNSWSREVLSAHTHRDTHTHHSSASKVRAPRLLSLLLLPHLLQLAEVFTLPQQLAQWLHVLLAEAAAREPAGGGGTGWNLPDLPSPGS